MKLLRFPKFPLQKLERGQQQEELPQLIEGLFDVVIEAHLLRDHARCNGNEEDLNTLKQAERKVYGASQAASYSLFDDEELDEAILLLNEAKSLIETINFEI